MARNKFHDVTGPWPAHDRLIVKHWPNLRPAHQYLYDRHGEVCGDTIMISNCVRRAKELGKPIPADELEALYLDCSEEFRNRQSDFRVTP